MIENYENLPTKDSSDLMRLVYGAYLKGLDLDGNADVELGLDAKDDTMQVTVKRILKTDALVKDLKKNELPR